MALILDPSGGMYVLKVLVSPNAMTGTMLAPVSNAIWWCKGNLVVRRQAQGVMGIATDVRMRAGHGHRAAEMQSVLPKCMALAQH